MLVNKKDIFLESLNNELNQYFFGNQEIPYNFSASFKVAEIARNPRRKFDERESHKFALCMRESVEQSGTLYLEHDTAVPLSCQSEA